MEIPQNVQDKFKCSECDELLSCGPVYLLHESGGTICGRCSQQSDDSTEINDRSRNEPYEATASLFAFPCAFAARGCSEKVSFTLGRPLHESSCKFRPFMCPIAPPGSCDWIGSWPQLKEHCDEKHKSNVLENECNLPRPDLTASNLRTYLISAFSFLFLLHVKVCVASGKLFHSVRMFGDSKLSEKFSYFFTIEGNSLTIKKDGSVLPTELMVIQESTKSSIVINSLLGMLDFKYNEAKFTIKIQTSLSDSDNSISKVGCGPSTSDVRFLVSWNCLNCSKNSESKFCETCAKQLIKCKFNGRSCSFVDVNRNKCLKHETRFCEYQSKCCNCGVKFVGGSFIEHLRSSNCSYKTTEYHISSEVRIANTNSNYYFILFSSNNIGTVICRYNLSDSNLHLYLHTLLPSFELKNFKCSIELRDPQLSHSKILTPDIYYNNSHDWYINEDLDNFISWRNVGIFMKIIIDKL